MDLLGHKCNAVTGNPALFTSDRQDWETPPWLFNLLDKEFDFDIDCACTVKNKLGGCTLGFAVDFGIDALKLDWHKEMSAFNRKKHTPAAFINPPYGKGGLTGKWIQKTRDEAQHGFIYVMLIPARTDTKAWHEIIMPQAREIRLIKGRLTFNLDGEPVRDAKGKPAPAPFPSAIIVFRPSSIRGRFSSFIQPKKEGA